MQTELHGFDESKFFHDTVQQTVLRVRPHFHMSSENTAEAIQLKRRQFKRFADHAVRERETMRRRVPTRVYTMMSAIFPDQARFCASPTVGEKNAGLEEMFVDEKNCGHDVLHIDTDISSTGPGGDTVSERDDGFAGLGFAASTGIGFDAMDE